MLKVYRSVIKKNIIKRSVWVSKNFCENFKLLYIFNLMSKDLKKSLIINIFISEFQKFLLKLNWYRQQKYYPNQIKCNVHVRKLHNLVSVSIELFNFLLVVSHLIFPDTNVFLFFFFICQKKSTVLKIKTKLKRLQCDLQFGIAAHLLDIVILGVFINSSLVWLM